MGSCLLTRQEYAPEGVAPTSSDAVTILASFCGLKGVGGLLFLMRPVGGFGTVFPRVSPRRFKRCCR
jgi:hypothetical protein